MAMVPVHHDGPWFTVTVHPVLRSIFSEREVLEAVLDVR
jgi:hypothetical protein